MGRVSPKDGMTKGMRAYKDNRLKGMTKVDAARSAKPHIKHPSVWAGQVEEHPAYQKSIQEALKEKGITVDRRAQNIEELLRAEDNLGPLHKVRLETEKHIADLVGDKAPTKSITAHVSEESIIEKLKREAAEDV